MNGRKFSVRDCNKAAKQQTTNTKHQTFPKHPLFCYKMEK